MGRQIKVILGSGVHVIFIWEINFGFLAANFAGLSIVGSSSFFGGVEGAKPNADSFPWIANLSSPFAPGALPDTSIQVLPLPLGGGLIHTIITFLKKIPQSKQTSAKTKTEISLAIR